MNGIKIELKKVFGKDDENGGGLSRCKGTRKPEFSMETEAIDRALSL